MIFELRSRTNYHSIRLRADIEEMFRGESVASGWQPVVAEFSEKLPRRRVGDFPRWGSIPVFSEQAAEALADILGSSGELLPIRCDGISLRAFNVTRVADILDEERSDLERFSSGRVMRISRYEFDARKIPADLSIFKLPSRLPSRVFVTDLFVRRVQDADLRGFRFEQLWPAEPKMEQELRPPKSLDELMNRDAQGELEDDFDTELWHMLCDRITSIESLRAWPEPVRAYYASRLLEWEVGNGGFAQAAMNIPEWFEEAAKGYEVLGKPQCAALIRRASTLAKRETEAISKAGVTLEKAFEYFDEGHFEEFDNQLDNVGWWSDEDRVDFVRANRAAFSDTKRL